MSSIDPYFEKQYNNRNAVVDHPYYLQQWARDSKQFRHHPDAVRHLADLAYSDHPRALLDVFPAATANAPLHLFIHGGYWQAQDKNSFSFVARHLNAAGETAVIINYPLCPDRPLSAISEQIRVAMCWLHRHADELGICCGQIQLTGHSAGAHLAAELLVTDWESRQVTAPNIVRANLLSGLYDLRPLINTSVNLALQLDQSAATGNSPLYRVPRLTAPLALNLWVGSDESDEYHRQSRQLAEQWSDPLLTTSMGSLESCHHFSVLSGFLTQQYRPLAA